ncbi:hypothetical protein C1H46_045770 [Malus baccata]|uniref:Uncharacterized protein n=1 Tax=Malus baccata TaxID=106549 RepID=A0A540K356_MALBA|nr:hypothetical protein C1H46_045770 [Malus baccata]
MAMASPVKVVLGSIAVAVFWVLAVFPAVPFLPIGRTTGSLLGATLMVVFRVLTPDQAYADIDLPIIGLLFLDNGCEYVSRKSRYVQVFGQVAHVENSRSKGLALSNLFDICSFERPLHQ